MVCQSTVFSLCQTQYLPVAQLDNASDSDSEDHEFESRRAGHFLALF